jgi:hypothetical protein
MGILDKLLNRTKGAEDEGDKTSNSQSPATSSTVETAGDVQKHVLTPQQASTQGSTSNNNKSALAQADSSNSHVPRTNYQHTGGNAGMLVGAVADTASPVTGMLEGQVIGGMIGQRIQQAKNHEHWKGQAAEYRDAVASGDTARANAAVSGGTSDRAVRRNARREKRWEKRAGGGDSAK